MENDTDQIADRDQVALPVIRGARWFGREPRPFLLRVEVSLSSEEMVAALYGVVQRDEIDTCEDLCGCVAVTLLVEGLPAVQARAARLRAIELRGGLESPEFLALCRKRVAELLAV